VRIIMLNKFPSNMTGGVETVVRDLAIKFSKLKYHCTIFSTSPKVNLYKILGYDLNKTPEGFVELENASFFRFGAMTLSITAFINYFIIIKKSKKRKTILFYHDPSPIFWLLLLIFPKRIKLIVYWHAELISYKKFHFLINFFRKKIIKKSCLNLFSNIKTQNAIHKSLYSEEEIIRNSLILPLGVNVDPVLFKHEINSKDINDDLPKKYNLIIGRLAYYKGLSVLLKAVQKNGSTGKYPIIIVGKVSDQETKVIIDELVKYPNIYYISNFVSENTKYKLIKDAYSLLFLSNQTSEAYGIIQVEALSLGTPIINLNIGSGVPEVTKYKNKVCGITLNNDASLITKLSDFLNHGFKENRKILSKRCRNNYIDNYSPQILDKKFNEIIHKINYK